MDSIKTHSDNIFQDYILCQKKKRKHIIHLLCLIESSILIALLCPYTYTYRILVIHLLCLIGSSILVARLCPYTYTYPILVIHLLYLIEFSILIALLSPFSHTHRILERHNINNNLIILIFQILSRNLYQYKYHHLLKLFAPIFVTKANILPNSYSSFLLQL